MLDLSCCRRCRTSGEFEYDCLRPTEFDTVRHYSNSAWRNDAANSAQGWLRWLAQFDLADVDAARIGDRQTVFSQPLEMQSDRLPDELLGHRARRASCDYAREGGYESAPTSRGLLVHYGPGAQRASFDRPDWRRMLPSVPGASSWLGLPATVTRPGFVGWRNCR